MCGVLLNSMHSSEEKKRERDRDREIAFRGVINV